LVLTGHLAEDMIGMPDEPPPTSLVTCARNGDKRARGMVVERRAPIIWSICRLHGLSSRDTDDVDQSVCRRLVERVDPETAPDDQLTPGERWLFIAERDAALHEAFTVLSPRCQHLLAMLVANPPVSCAGISATLGIAASSIRPFRRGCLDALRHRLPLAPVISGETRTR
jgi:hypothetical protein